MPVCAATEGKRGLFPGAGESATNFFEKVHPGGAWGAGVLHCCADFFAFWAVLKNSPGFVADTLESCDTPGSDSCVDHKLTNVVLHIEGAIAVASQVWMQRLQGVGPRESKPREG